MPCALAWFALRLADQTITNAGWMRRYARRSATRRSSWRSCPKPCCGSGTPWRFGPQRHPATAGRLAGWQADGCSVADTTLPERPLDEGRRPRRTGDVVCSAGAFAISQASSMVQRCPSTATRASTGLPAGWQVVKRASSPSPMWRRIGSPRVQRRLASGNLWVCLEMGAFAIGPAMQVRSLRVLALARAGPAQSHLDLADAADRVCRQLPAHCAGSAWRWRSSDLEFTFR